MRRGFNKFFFQHRKRNITIVAAVSFVFLASFAALHYYDVMLTRIQKEFESYSLVNSFLPCMMTSYGRSGDTLSARFAFSTPAGKPLGIYERSWEGWELKMEYIRFPTKKGFLIFPYKIYSDAGYGSGIRLFKYYKIKGEPGIYTDLLSSSRQKALKDLFFLIRSFTLGMQLFGDIKIETIRIRTFEKDTDYQLFIDNLGLVYFRKS